MNQNVQMNSKSTTSAAIADLPFQIKTRKEENIIPFPDIFAALTQPVSFKPTPQSSFISVEPKSDFKHVSTDSYSYRPNEVAKAGDLPRADITANTSDQYSKPDYSSDKSVRKDEAITSKSSNENDQTEQKTAKNENNNERQKPSLEPEKAARQENSGLLSSEKSAKDLKASIKDLAARLIQGKSNPVEISSYIKAGHPQSVLSETLTSVHLQNQQDKTKEIKKPERTAKADAESPKISAINPQKNSAQKDSDLQTIVRVVASNIKDQNQNVSRETLNKSFEQKSTAQKTGIQTQDVLFSAVKELGKSDKGSLSQNRFEHTFAERSQPSLNTAFRTSEPVTGTLGSRLQTQVNQILSQGRLILQNNENASFTVQLQPKDLGRVNVHLTLTDGVLSGRLLVENESVQRVLTDALNRSLEELKNNGTQLSAFSVDVRSGEQQNSETFRDLSTELENSLQVKQTEVSAEAGYLSGGLYA